MKGITKLLVLAVVFVFTMSIFAGCSKKETDKTEQTTTQEATSADNNNQTATETTGDEEKVAVNFDEPAEYSWWLFATPFDYYTSYNDNPIVNYLSKKYNVTFNFQQPSAGTETEALNLMFATGELTDLVDVQTYSGSTAELFSDGLIIDIAEYLEYMPNLSKLLDENEVIRKNLYTDDGKILGLPNIYDTDPLMWGGLIYRRDILDAMTSGNIQFPSGQDEPTTIEDWDYMLPLYKQYFEAAGMVEYAPLILPSGGLLPTNELVGSFGTAGTYYVDNGQVKYGPYEQGFYNYLKKMNEWYEAGYIYKDFASRTDPFYLPNTSLTYGLSAGIWFGLSSQLGEALSMPDYNITVDIRALKNPYDTASGINERTNTLYNTLYANKNDISASLAITSKCENIEKLLTILDFMYSEEGSILKACGLDKEHGSADDPIYQAAGLQDGFYSYDADGKMVMNPQLGTVGGPIADTDAFKGIRLPGLSYVELDNEVSSDVLKEANIAWTTYIKNSIKVPASLSRTVEEDEIFIANNSQLNDYIGAMIIKFIVGGEELNETSWQAFKDQMDANGIQENLKIMQAAYDRYQNR